MNRFDYGNQLKKRTKVELLEECRKLNVFYKLDNIQLFYFSKYCFAKFPKILYH